MPRLFAILCAILALAMALPARAAEGEAPLFKAATDAFKDKFYTRAEEQFAAFTTNYPASTNLAEAVLYQAQARHFQKKHDAAIELLKAHLPKAGGLTGQYLLTWGEALSARGDHAGAAEQYGRIVKELTDSPLRLQAAYLQAFSFFQLQDFARTIELLKNPEGDFQKLASAAPQDRFSFAGGLLLGDALLAANKAEEARTVATALAPAADRPEWQWERHDLLARTELAGTNSQAALPHLTNAVAAAQAAQRPRLQAQSWNLEAEVYRKLGQPRNAIGAYEKIAAIDALPIDQRRLAVLKSVELFSSSGNLTNAINRLESYLAGTTNEPAADLLRVKAGELWIEQVRQTARGGKPAGAALVAVTNGLAQARAHLNGVITQYTNSTHLGRAWLNLGWTYWEEGILFEQPGRMQESGAAFQTASEKLTRSDDQALALFKLADTQLYLDQPRRALTNYEAVITNYADLPQVKNALFGRTYAQLIRASLQLNDFEGARRHLAELRQNFPNAPLTEESLFLFGQALVRQGAPEEARKALQDFLNNYPASPFAPEVRLAEGRTYGMEGNYETALQKHEQWLGSFTNHFLRPEVEFQRGVLLDKLGQATNALTAFTAFVTRHPASPLAPAAQTWIADFYYGQQQWLLAEQNYQHVFQNTNWTGSPLAYQSRLMAARTAFRRQNYSDARSYLTTLVNDPQCPAELQPQAWFALGDVFLEEPITSSTNAVYNFIQGATVFDRIVNQYPSNSISILALAKKGDCHFQIGSLTNYPTSYIEATNAYWGVLKSSFTDLPPKVYNQAEFGLARVLERMAEGKDAPERDRLRAAALDHYLNIVYGQSGPNARGPSDPFYLKLAGREGGRLAEAMGDTAAAIQLYKRLITEAPALKAMWEGRITLLGNTLEQSSALR